MPLRYYVLLIVVCSVCPTLGQMLLKFPLKSLELILNIYLYSFYFNVTPEFPSVLYDFSIV